MFDLKAVSLDRKTDGFYFLCHHKNSESSVLIGSGPLDVYC
uniref:Uncharacterized protein n=1 Tax=Vitis vinifera TaxID=29760 RepID=F6HML8_VITVI